MRLLLVRVIRFTLLGLVLVMVMMVSAVTAMRFAIHGRELLVPDFVGMQQAEAERFAGDRGLLLAADDHFYSATTAEGGVLSQAPPAGVRVRRGARVRLAVSLGPPKTEVPDLVGQTVRAALINLQRRRLDFGEISTILLPDTSEPQILSQAPSPGVPASTSRVSLLVSAHQGLPQFLMPDFTGRHLAEVSGLIEEAGFELRVKAVKKPGGSAAPPPSVQPAALKRGAIVHQSPAPGKRIVAKSVISLEVTVP